ncbi:MAG: hypothetical protein AB1726_11235 [Planctomycetota bacterium]
MDPRLAALDRLRAGVEGLLSLLAGSSDPGAAALASAERRCGEAFGALRSLDIAADPAVRAWPAPVRERAAEVRRLLAVVLERLAARRDEISAARAGLARTRAHLEALAGEGRTGRSCDIRG